MILEDHYNVHLKWWLAVAFFCTWCFLWFCQLLAIFYGRYRLHRPILKNASLTYPGVSIAKPLVSMADPNLQDNLETYFHLDYVPYEVLFCVQSESQVDLIKMVRNLMAKHPNIDSRLFIGAQNVGVNPKVNNMMNAYDKSKYPFFLISDAGVRVTEDTLTDMANRAMSSESVGIVHQLPLMLDGARHSGATPPFSRILEKVYFATSQARMYLSAAVFGLNCMTSMSCMVRRSMLEEFGGLGAFGCYIGEDFFIGQTMVSRGYKMLLSTQPVQQDPGMSSTSAWQQRMTRWMHLRFSALPQLVFLEPISETIFYLPLVTWAVFVLFEVPPHVFLPCHLTVWCIFDYILLRVVEGKRPPFSLWCYVKVWFVRELSVPYIYMSALSMRTLSWGGRRFRLRWGGKAEEVGGGDVATLPV